LVKTINSVMCSNVTYFALLFHETHDTNETCETDETAATENQQVNHHLRNGMKQMKHFLHQATIDSNKWPK